MGSSSGAHAEVAFLHPQTAVLVLGELDAASREQLHAAVVETRAGDDASPEIALELIDHVLGAGDRIDADRRADLLVAAGRRAMHLGAWAPAAAAFDAATEALDESDERFDEVQWAASLAHFRNHDRRGSERHARARAERGRATGNLAVWGDALEVLTRLQLTVGSEIVGQQLDGSAIEDFLAAAGDREPKLRARLTGALAELCFVAFDFDAGLAYSDAARRIAAEVDDDELTAVTEFVEGIQRLGRLQVAEAEACFVASRDHADRLPDGWLRTWGRGRLPLVRWAQGHFAEAWTAIDDGLDVAEANHDWAELSIVHAAAVGLAAAEGRFETAEEHAVDAARTFARSEYAYTPGVLYPALAMARARRADRDGAAAALASWRAQGAAGLPSTFELFVAAAVGDVDGTRELLARHPWRPRADRPVDLATLAFAAGYVDVADLLDDPTISDPVIPILEEAHGRGLRFLLAGGPGSLSRHLATAHRLAGHVERATEMLDAAARDLRAAPSRLGEAELRYERALRAMATGDATAAASFAAEAAAAYDDIGAFAGLARADAVRRRVTRGDVQPARRTRVILVTDLVGSTPLNVALGDDRYHELLQEHDRTITDLVRRHRGVPFNHSGDGMLAWFDRGDDAAACALAFQPALDDLNRAHPEHPLQVRCGLAAGEPIDEDGNVFGLAVSRAAARLRRGGRGRCARLRGGDGTGDHGPRGAQRAGSTQGPPRTRVATLAAACGRPSLTTSRPVALGNGGAPMPGMPYHLEKGPLLSVLDAFCNTGTDARLVTALVALRNGARLTDVGAFDSPNLYHPSFPFPFGNKADLVGHFETHWLGKGSLNASTKGKQTGHWQFYKGPVESIMRETLIRALELALGVPHKPNDKAPVPTRHWTIDFWWKCPQPWFEGWVTWRNAPTGGKVTVIFATPSDDGVVLREPLTEADEVLAPVTSATEGSWLISSERHRQELQLTVVPTSVGAVIFPTTWTVDDEKIVTVSPWFGSGGTKDGGWPYKGGR